MQTFKWHPCWNSKVPTDRKIMLRRNDKMYFGVFVKCVKGTYYFNLDAYGNTILRRADWWCDIPEELLQDPLTVGGNW